MRAAVLHGARDIRLEDRPEETIGAGRVRVRFGAGGICGSDIHYFLHGRSGEFVAVEPLILGHEIAGDVVEVGSGVTAPAVGDRVALYPARTCGTCDYCRAGRDNLCPETRFFGSASRTPHVQGGFREQLVVDADQCYPVPPHIEPAIAAFAEPLAVCVHAVQRAGEVGGSRVLVTGAGPIGLLLTLAARRACAASVAVSDLVDEPLEIARKIGVDDAVNSATDPDALLGMAERMGGFDVVLEASGNPKATASALELVRRGGVIVQVGNLAPGDTPLPASRIMTKEVELRGSMRFTRQNFETSVDLITSGAVDVRPLLTHQEPLARAAEAIDLAADRRRSMKVMLVGS